MAYTGTLFGAGKKPESQHQHKDFDKLVKIQADLLRQVFGKDCLNVEQLQQVLNLGESNVRDWLNKCPAVRVINRRKVVPIIWMAYYLVTGEM